MAISLTQGQPANNGDAPRLRALPLDRRRKQGNDRGLPQDRRIFAAKSLSARCSEIFCAQIANRLAPVLLAFPPAIV
jgi:hypothetical protein